MKTRFHRIKMIVLLLMLLQQGIPLLGQKAQSGRFTPWQPGYLDIHHINTGEGNSTFVQMPDGTTLLVDVGTVDKAAFESRHSPLKATASLPDSLRSAGARVAGYIQQMSTSVRENRRVDYLVATHFHSDHIGGIPDFCAEITPVKMIDRAYPTYNFPFDLKIKLKKDLIFQNYIKLVEQANIDVEKMVVGSNGQIGLLKDRSGYPTFQVLNLKNGASLWNPQKNQVLELFSAEEMIAGGYNENPLSMAFKISYGDFDYYLGADNTGLQDGILPKWFDVETPLARAVGPVDAMTLNHHGNRDANNAFFIGALDPKVAIQQVYSSDQPGQEVFYRLRNIGRAKSRLLYATNMHSETRATYGPWFDKAYQSMQGHVVIRVYPSGKMYRVYVLDEADLSIRDESVLIRADE